MNLSPRKCQNDVMIFSPSQDETFLTLEDILPQLIPRVSLQRSYLHRIFHPDRESESNPVIQVH